MSAEISEKNRSALAFLLSEVAESYRESSEDRARLHRLEWDSGGDEPSVLGAVELRADTVVGAVRSMMHERSDSRTKELMRSLASSGVHSSAALSSWLSAEAANYPGFARHVQAIEHLRAMGLWVWRSKLDVAG